MSAAQLLTAHLRLVAQTAKQPAASAGRIRGGSSTVAARARKRAALYMREAQEAQAAYRVPLPEQRF